MTNIVLASSSRHRAAQLKRLGLDFDTFAPDIDETACTGEPVEDLVIRLGKSKAEIASAAAPGHLVIASDQSAALTDGAELHRLGKPGTVAAAADQLRRISGRDIAFMTSLVVLDDRADRLPCTMVDVDVTHVRLRRLNTDEIDRYIARDEVLDCAGSFRVESLGIALFEHIKSEDPTALVGLPLIRLAARLRECGLRVP